MPDTRTGAAPFTRMVPIQHPDGSLVTEFVSVSSWRDLKLGTDTPPDAISPAALLDEEHHRAYGRPWCLGRGYFDHLVARGLRRDDRVLDLGCGAGRVGVWLIAYLDAGRYFGVDHHLGTLAAFAGYECNLHGLFDKQPRLMLDDQFRVEGFGTQFDVILDLHVSAHLEMDGRERLFRALRPVCAPGARIFVPHKPKLSREFFAEAGLSVVHREEVEYALLKDLDARCRIQDRWYELRFNA